MDTFADEQAKLFKKEKSILKIFKKSCVKVEKTLDKY